MPPKRKVQPPKTAEEVDIPKKTKKVVQEEEENNGEVEVVEKKRRGRAAAPKKDAKAEESSNQQDEEPEDKPKKGGRPPKKGRAAKKDVDDEEVNGVDSGDQKKRRGVAKKESSDDLEDDGGEEAKEESNKEEDVEDDDVQEKPKAKGRAKKGAAEDVEDDGGQEKPKAKGRAKKETSEDAEDDGAQEKPKAKGRPKKEAPADMEVDDGQAKPKGRGRAKKESSDDVEDDGAEEKPKAKGRRKKEATADMEVDDTQAKPKARGRAKKESSDDVEDDGAEEKPKPKGRPKKPTSKDDEGLLNPTETKWEEIQFTTDKVNPKGEACNTTITSWNVDGIRAWLKKDGLSILEHAKPDILCLQETKCSEDKLPEEVKEIDGYKSYWCASDKDGYAGVAILTKAEPIKVDYGIGDEEQDTDGRCITAEYEKYILVCVYVPNAGRKLITLDKRLEWNASFKKYIAELNKKKPVIVCGDMNVAHSEIDLANPKTNTKNAGFTKEERDGMTEFLQDGYVDVYRKLYPDEKNTYTFWTYMSKSRAKNVGWRLDYFIVPETFMDNVCEIATHSKVFGSDHCPISLFFNV